MIDEKNSKCSKCLKEIGHVGVLSPSLDPLSRHLCMECAEKRLLGRKETKILMLDIDGVCNNVKTSNIDGWPIDPFCAFLVGRIVLETGCGVVLSSSWRHSAEGRAVVRRKVVPLLGFTDLDGMESLRGHQIASWLKANPEVTKYAILDDDDDMLIEQKPHFFQTTWEEGLTEEIAKMVIEHLED